MSLECEQIYNTAESYQRLFTQNVCCASTMPLDTCTRKGDSHAINNSWSRAYSVYLSSEAAFINRVQGAKNDLNIPCPICLKINNPIKRLTHDPNVRKLHSSEKSGDELFSIVNN